jgi:hypothetical protein
MGIVEIIARAWGWKGLVPKAVVDRNAFGNLVVVDHHDRYWRICPEELSCTAIAASADEYATIRSDKSFMSDWAMTRLHEMALETLGPIPNGKCYCLKVPAVLGGEYSSENLGTIDLDELISFAGTVALQIDGLPDGAKIEFKFDRPN